MNIPPKYILTSQIAKHLQTIEANREMIAAITIPPEIETNIRRRSLLKSSLFSARIEGNPLTLAEVTARPSKDMQKQEVYNILQGLQFVRNRGSRDITQSVLLELHRQTMKQLIDRENLSAYRKEVSAIFNSAGIAVYMPPPPKQVPAFMERLLKFINSDKESFAPIRAALAHYTFEKIHPFLDGNGRVGRLLLQAVLEKSGYGMKGLLTVEEFLDSNRSEYYAALMESERDTTSYVEFMLDGIAKASESAKKLMQSQEEAAPEEYLLPRRSEIYNLIKDHTMMNFDQIRRRFMAVNERTLRYDLKKLQEAGLIRKLGTTKGVYYEVKN